MYPDIHVFVLVSGGVVDRVDSTHAVTEHIIDLDNIFDDPETTLASLDKREIEYMREHGLLAGFEEYLNEDAKG